MASASPPITPRSMPGHVAVIGAAGGLGQGILRVCREEKIAFTAVVRSRPERVADVPEGPRVVTVASLADQAALTEAFSGTDAVLTAMGVTSTSSDSSALLSANMGHRRGIDVGHWSALRSTPAAPTNALWRRPRGTVPVTRGRPFPIKLWVGGCWRRQGPMSLSARRPWCRDAESRRW